VYPFRLRSFFTRCPNARKNCASAITHLVVGFYEQKHHEQISCSAPSLGMLVLQLKMHTTKTAPGHFLIPSLVVLTVGGFLISCNTDHPRLVVNSEAREKDWFIRSYENGVVTVEHQGNKYTGTCDVSRSFENAPSVAAPDNVIESSKCYLAVDFIGRNVQPLEGNQKDANGWTVNMWNVGPTLALRRWRDERTPWQQEEYKITSVESSRK
jgi:hypothetical protein